MKKEREILRKIDECLKAQGMTRKELAEKLGCSVRLVHYWCKGERRISIDMANKVLNLLGATFELGCSDSLHNDMKEIK